MKLSATERLDAVNIGLMLLACGVAIVIPFELFLFSYAILGPLHYLTEISWLHDRNYYTKGKYDALFLLIIGLLVTLSFFNSVHGLELDLPRNFSTRLAWIAFLSSLVFVLVKNNFYRITGIFLIIVSSQLSTHFWLFLSVFLPTLVHVYLFTGLFMLYGALKSKSRLGIISVVVLALCPILLFQIFPDTVFIPVTDYGREAYIGGEKGVGFFNMHIQSLISFFDYNPQGKDLPYWLETVFNSKTGILLARFIAFAYTYHYLNWFSKTRVIQWHKVPKARFALVLVFWAISIALYATNYTLGLQWLFFLSYLHVLLEFPLNYTSVIGIGRSLRERFSGQTVAPAGVPAGGRKAESLQPLRERRGEKRPS
jgi:hypothetical protein